MRLDQVASSDSCDIGIRNCAMHNTGIKHIYNIEQSFNHYCIIKQTEIKQGIPNTLNYKVTVYSVRLIDHFAVSNNSGMTTFGQHNKISNHFLCWLAFQFIACKFF